MTTIWIETEKGLVPRPVAPWPALTHLVEIREQCGCCGAEYLVRLEYHRTVPHDDGPRLVYRFREAVIL